MEPDEASALFPRLDDSPFLRQQVRWFAAAVLCRAFLPRPSSHLQVTRHPRLRTNRTSLTNVTLFTRYAPTPQIETLAQSTKALSGKIDGLNKVSGTRCLAAPHGRPHGEPSSRARGTAPCGPRPAPCRSGLLLTRLAHAPSRPCAHPLPPAPSRSAGRPKVLRRPRPGLRGGRRLRRRRLLPLRPASEGVCRGGAQTADGKRFLPGFPRTHAARPRPSARRPGAQLAPTTLRPAPSPRPPVGSPSEPATLPPSVVRPQRLRLATRRSRTSPRTSAASPCSSTRSRRRSAPPSSPAPPPTPPARSKARAAPAFAASPPRRLAVARFLSRCSFPPLPAPTRNRRREEAPGGVRQAAGGV